MTEPLASMTYALIMSRVSICIALFIAALNVLDVLLADIGGEYLNALCREKIWFRAKDKLGSGKCRVVVIVCVPYGLRSTGAAWGSILAETMHDLGFMPCLADPNIWMCKGRRSEAFCIGSIFLSIPIVCLLFLIK